MANVPLLGSTSDDDSLGIRSKDAKGLLPERVGAHTGDKD